MDQTSMFDVSASLKSDAYRTQTGMLKASTKKAIAWYAIEHGLRLTAASAYPVIYFVGQSGAVAKANVNDIVTEYKDFKKRSHGKRRAAA